ncbi:MAG TPA: hypothetical protein VKC57_10885, partial [Ktedonobacterales bacterium]|nr:hypothetical protein [Ktedonobacterales bacterium]
MRTRELPLLAAVAGFMRWCEELLIVVSGPLLTVGLGIALVDLLTGGALLAAQPELLYAWAISQAAGVDAQLVASAAKLAAAVHTRRYWLAAGYGVLIMPLAYVGFLASNVFATQQSQGLTTAEALARLGMDGTSWIVQRSALAVALVVLSGLLRYRPPAAEASAEDERAQLERELTLEPLRAQLRARKALGWRDVGRAITRGAAATGVEAPPTHAQEGAGMAAAGETVEQNTRPTQQKARQSPYNRMTNLRQSRPRAGQPAPAHLPQAGVRTGVPRALIGPKCCASKPRQSGSGKAGGKRRRGVRTARGYVPLQGPLRRRPRRVWKRRPARHGSRGCRWANCSVRRASAARWRGSTARCSSPRERRAKPRSSRNSQR